MQFPPKSTSEMRRNVRKLIELALHEDLPRGDITSRLALKPRIGAFARVRAKEALVVCGLPLIREIVRAHGSRVQIKFLQREGARVVAGQTIAELRGDARALLELERTILNFLQRLSGVATYTSSVMRSAKGIRVLDTRKTMPGWRALDKYAVRVGGGTNHRGSLSDMILVKNNHIDGAGGVDIALSRVMRGRPRGIKVEVEVRTIDELLAVIRYRPDIIMLDNFSIARIRLALKILRRKLRSCLVEVSGGVRPGRFAALRKAGVGLVSMGALTTQARNVDISMALSIESPKSEKRVVGSKK